MIKLNSTLYVQLCAACDMNLLLVVMSCIQCNVVYWKNWLQTEKQNVAVSERSLGASSVLCNWIWANLA